MFQPSPAPTTDQRERPLVLVVDDEYGPRESIAYTLSSEFEVVTAARASEGLKRIQERPFSVVILDIRMPEMDGIRALEAIRKIDREISVVMLTGYGTLQTAQQSMVHGANQYLRKPPDIAELMESVRKQASAAKLRRHQANLNLEMESLNGALKREIEEKQPHIWQARAAVELVHDLANPLTVLIGYASLLVQESKKMARRDPEQAEKFLNYADVVSRAAEYCHHLADNWKQTTRKATEFCDLDLVALVRDVKEVIFFNNSAIQIQGAAVARVRGSQFELTRVLQNLLKNAMEAGANHVDVSVHERPNGIELLIADDGSGMDKETADRALRGGFTTKANGTGLGLGICRHLLGAHGASLALDTSPARGTTIRINFPVTDF
ncbi:MAG TPA: hybrid sensor histidine kinase/response regulator [Opitutaceae bacterium]|nr:hybrid sensor histidine kinase/response regulator [Opitutaceae bacterium]